jgi:hypothetical protein
MASILAAASSSSSHSLVSRSGTIAKAEDAGDSAASPANQIWETFNHSLGHRPQSFHATASIPASVLSFSHLSLRIDPR